MKSHNKATLKVKLEENKEDPSMIKTLIIDSHILGKVISGNNNPREGHVEECHRREGLV